MIGNNPFSREQLKLINDNPKIVSLLYDIGLLPEQVIGWIRMAREEEQEKAKAALLKVSQMKPVVEAAVSFWMSDGGDRRPEARLYEAVEAYETVSEKPACPTGAENVCAVCYHRLTDCQCIDRRDRNKKPRPEMYWSEKHGMWVDPDTRTAEEKARHEEIAKDLEKRECHLGPSHVHHDPTCGGQVEDCGDENHRIFSAGKGYACRNCKREWI